MTLKIYERHLKQISAHSKEFYPTEACGIMIGTATSDERLVREVWPAKNELSSQSRYEIHPETLLRAFTYAEQNGLEVVGFYHSHPHWSADASEIDRTRANYPGVSYLIYSVSKNETKSFVFNGKELISEDVKVSADQAQTLRCVF